MELLESLVSYITVGLIGAAIIWWPNRTIKRQFLGLMEAVDAGMEQGKDWKFVRDEAGNPTGFRRVMGASASTDDPNAI